MFETKKDYKETEMWTLIELLYGSIAVKEQALSSKIFLWVYESEQFLRRVIVPSKLIVEFLSQKSTFKKRQWLEKKNAYIFPYLSTNHHTALWFILWTPQRHPEPLLGTTDFLHNM